MFEPNYLIIKCSRGIMVSALGLQAYGPGFESHSDQINLFFIFVN